MLTQTQVAQALQLHETTVRRWRIPCHRLGRVPRYVMTEVREYLESRAFKRRLKQLDDERHACGGR